MSKTLRWLLFFLGFSCGPAFAQVTGPPFVYVSGTVINPDEVNLNFSTIYAAALNRAGGTMTGNLLFSADNTLDIGASGATRPRDLFLGRNAAIAGTLGVTGATTLSSTLAVTGVTTLAALSATTGTFSGALTGTTLALSNTGATAIDVNGGITAGTGNVAIIGTDGRIPAISSTYFASLSGANLTGIVETAITDGSILARVASAETISGLWAFSNTGTTTFAGSITLAVTGTKGFYADNSGGTDIPIGEVTGTNQLNIGFDNALGLNDTVVSAGQSLRFRTNSAERLVISNAGTLTHAGALVRSNIIDGGLLVNGSNNNLNPSGLASASTVVLVSAGGSTALTGITAQVHGFQLKICTDGIVSMQHDTTSTDANRFYIHGGTANLTNGCVDGIYDTAADGGVGKWRLAAW